MHWIPHTSIHIERLQVQVSIPFITKDIAIIRILVTGGGHLEFSHEKVDKKMETVFFQSLRVNISEKSQLFKIYMKKSQNVFLLHNSVYYIARNLDLRKCIDICRTYENTASQLKVISGNAEDVHRVERKPVRPMRHGPAPRNARQTFRPCIDCKFCGRNHKRKTESCPAWGQVCKKCRGKNHFAKCCPLDVRRKTHGVTGEYPQSSHADDYEDGCILSVETEAMHSVSTHPTALLYTEMRLPDRKPLRMQIDSGATVNVKPAKHVGSAKLMHPDVQLRMYNKATVKPLGKCRLHLVNPVNNQRYQVEFQVVEENLTPLLSRKAAERMNLITVNYANFKQLHVVGRANCEAITDEFKTVFEGASIGCLPGTVSLKTEDGASPTTCANSTAI